MTTTSHGLHLALSAQLFPTQTCLDSIKLMQAFCLILLLTIYHCLVLQTAHLPTAPTYAAAGLHNLML